ncbi:MAG: hypothetical protein LBK29_01585, partial [Oscillospiraceae bacterium]|nr:hypothetical protein [Oscillospiraceae bacterium]
MVKNKNFSKNLAMLLALAVFSGNAGAVPAGPHSKDKKPTSLAKHSISFGALGSLGVLSLLGLGVYSQREWILIKYYEGKLDSIAEPKELIRTANKFLPFIKSWEKEIRKDSSARSRIPEKYTNFYT